MLVLFLASATTSALFGSVIWTVYSYYYSEPRSLGQVACGYLSLPQLSEVGVMAWRLLR